LVKKGLDVVVDNEDRKAHGVKLAFNRLLVGDALLHRAAKGAFVGVFQSIADGESARHHRQADSQGLKAAVEVECGGVALHGRAQRKQNLRDAFSCNALDKVVDAEVARPHSVHRRNESAQHVIATPKGLGIFKGEHVANVFDDAQCQCIAAAVGTNATDWSIAQRMALAAEGGLLGEVVNRIGQLQHSVVALLD
jgi:hypothetical protein